MALSKEQLEERLTGLGGSDIGAIAGVNDYKSIHDIYNEKRQLVAPFEGNAATDFGNIMEPVILEWYRGQLEDTDFLVSTQRDYVRHAEYPWMLALTDGLVSEKARDESGEIIPLSYRRGIVEAKTAHWRMADQWGEQGTDIIPKSYLLQVAWYMAILDVNWCDVVVLIAPEFRTYRITRDMELEAKLIQMGSDFWHNHVLTGIPPEVDGSDGCYERLAIEKVDEGEVESDEIADSLATKLKFYSGQMKTIEADSKRLKNELAAHLGQRGKKIRGTWGTFGWTSPGEKAKIDWQSIAVDAGASQNLIDEHTKFVATQRPSFRPYWAKEKK